MRFYSDLTGEDYALIDNTRGRAFLLVYLALGLPAEDVDFIAPWISAQELAAIKEQAARFHPTPENISREIQLTVAEHEQYGWRVKNGKRVKCGGILQFPPCDVDLKERQEQRNREKAAQRRERRRKAQADLMAKCRGPREREAMAILIRLSPRQPIVTAKDVINAITGEHFPAGRPARRAAVHRFLDCLERRGLATTGATWWGARTVTLIPDFAAQSVRTPKKAKVKQYQRVKPWRSVSPGKIA